MVYKTTQFISFRYADPARIMFYGNILDLTHDLFEEFIQKAGLTWKEWFEPKDWSCPIRHVSVDYLAPFLPGETYEVSIGLAKLGETSFTMKYLYSKAGSPHAKVSMVHTFTHRQKFEKMPIPPSCRKVLEPYLFEDKEGL